MNFKIHSQTYSHSYDVVPSVDRKTQSRWAEIPDLLQQTTLENYLQYAMNESNRNNQ